MPGINQRAKIKLPIGKSNFKKVIKEGLYFVDKTALIKAFIKNTSEATLITRPRRFGKTLNLSMMYYFFEMGLLEQGHEHLFDHFEISQDEEFCAKYQNQFPVIFISFKDLNSESYLGMIEQFQALIAKLYKSFKLCLYESLDRADLKKYDQFLEEEVSVSKLKSSISNLMRLLADKTGKQVILLIDEYDTPIINAYQEGYYKEMVALMKGLLGEALKDNRDLQFGLMTGITRVAKEGIFSGLNNLNVHSIINERYSQYFGFSEREVTDLLSECDTAISADSIKEWYNGYQFGSHTIYNPWSILNCLDAETHHLQPYWVNTSDNSLIKMLIKDSTENIKEVFVKLLQKESVTERVDECIILPNLLRDKSSLWGLLLHAGYLKPAKTELIEGDYYCNLCVPNAEVMMLYKKMIQEWFSTETLNTKHYESFMRSLIDTEDSDKAEFSRLLNRYLIDSSSVFDFSKNRAEQSFHTFVLGILIGLYDRYRIQSNRESGHGRFDVELAPRGDLKLGHLLELKVADSAEKLEETAELALCQIQEKSYITNLKEQGVKKVQLIGIAFYGKSAVVQSRLIELLSLQQKD